MPSLVLPPPVRPEPLLVRPLHEVTFVVIDLETTGMSPADCAITEIGAVKVCGGEVLGSLQTFVDPGTSIPYEITMLTGITQDMVWDAPPIATLLPTVLEFVGDAVVVGHNIRFDVSFLDAALVAHERPPLDNRCVDTVALARRLLGDDVPNARLSTVAEYLHAQVVPNHRAFDDARATMDVLHSLLELVAGYGVMWLDELLAFPSLPTHPALGRLALTRRLPRTPGVWTLRDPRGRALLVGSGEDVRASVRALWAHDTKGATALRRLLRQTAKIDVVRCDDASEAAGLEELLRVAG